MRALTTAITKETDGDRRPIETTTLTLDRDQVLYMEGDGAERCYRLKSGMISEYRMLLNGKRQLVSIYFPGDIVGVTPSETHDATTEATARSVVEVIPRSRLTRRLETDEDFRSQLVAQFLSRLTHTQAHVVLLGRLSALERVASFLVEFHKRQCKGAGDDRLVFIPMTRNLIADYLGLTHETVSRCFSTLKSRGLIELPKPNVAEIVDGAALAEVAYRDNGLCNWLCNA